MIRVVVLPACLPLSTLAVFPLSPCQSAPCAELAALLADGGVAAGGASTAELPRSLTRSRPQRQPKSKPNSQRRKRREEKRGVAVWDKHNGTQHHERVANYGGTSKRKGGGS